MFRLLPLLLLAACLPNLKVENPSREPNRKVPDSFLAEASSQPVENAGTKHYSEFFASAELRDLIDLAMKNNQELNQRVQEIIIASTEISARKGELWPRVGAGIDAGLEKVGGNTPQGRSDEAHGVPTHLPSFGFGFSASWEIDIFGKVRNAVKAADFRYMSTIEAKNYVVTQIVAEIARSYYELIALDNQLEVLNRNIAIQTDALEVVKLEKAAARVTQLAVQRFEAEVLKNRSRLYDLQRERVQTETRINFLVGRYPQPVARQMSHLMDPLPPAIQTGLPSSLLENRPDVRQAELELHATEMDVKVAWAKFFPSLSLDAALGYRSFDITQLVATPLSLIYNIAGNITAPLLNRAGIEAAYRTANAKQIQAVFEFEKTLLQAFTDVVRQLSKFENLKKSFELQQQQVELLTQSVEISNVLFRSARADYMEVLLTRRDSLDAQMELIETRKRLLLSTVSLYEALGGGWRPKEEHVTQ